MEAVAAERRELPPGGEAPEGYVFQGEGKDGEPVDVRLSELFAPGKDSLAIYSFMFPRDPEDNRPGPVREEETAKLPLAEGPCPSCVSLLDQFDGVVEHAGEHVNFAVVAKSPLPRVLTWARERGWRRLRSGSCSPGGRRRRARRPRSSSPWPSESRSSRESSRA